MYNYSDEVTNEVTKSRTKSWMKSRSDEVWIGQPDSQRTVDVEGGSCVDNTCGSTVLLSVRHIAVGVQRVRHTTVGVQSVRDTTVGVQSVRHITKSTYKKRAVENKGSSVTFQWRTWLETTT